jgi:hypothetical protein
MRFSKAYAGVRITAEWRGAEPTSGLGVVPGLARIARNLTLNHMQPKNALTCHECMLYKYTQLTCTVQRFVTTDLPNFTIITQETCCLWR